MGPCCNLDTNPYLIPFSNYIFNSFMVIREVIKMSGDETIEEVLKMLYERHVGSVVITDNEGKCTSIF
jgi:predicted transcriptional regulator